MCFMDDNPQEYCFFYVFIYFYLLIFYKKEILIFYTKSIDIPTSKTIKKQKKGKKKAGNWK